MNRSEKEKRDAEREARRARRLSDRASQRAKRQAEQAEIATRRAEDLARKARRRTSPRHRDTDRSIEDYVDDVAEKWSEKAEAWVDTQSRKWSDQSKDWIQEQSDMMSSSLHDDLHHGTGRTDEDDMGMDEYGFEADESRRRARRKKRQHRRTKAKSGWKRRNRNGNLYKNTKNKKIWGVCAGVADYWGMETWQVRMMAVMALFIVPSVAVPGYFIAGFVLDDKPYYKEVTDRFHELDEAPVTERRREKSSKKPKSRKAEAPTVPNVHALRNAKQKFSDIENRLRLMESHVTSPKFELQRELRKIAGDEV